jgi:hypothetical protein
MFWEKIVLKVVQSETCSARARPRRNVVPASASRVQRARHRLGVWSCWRVFPRYPVPSQGCYAPPEALGTGNASSPELPSNPLWTGSPFPVVRRARPQARPPPVRWSLGGPPCPYKGTAVPLPRRTRPPHPLPSCRRRHQGQPR